MAVAALQSSALDLDKSAKYSIRLGASIAKPAASTSYSGIRYNHRRTIDDSENVTSTIVPGKAPEDSVLRLKDSNQEDRYEGQHSKAVDSYALIIRDDGKQRSAVLEKLSHVHAYNLVSSTSERVEEYPQISLDDDADDLLGDEEMEEPVDPDNPFDFRHFLKAVAEETKVVRADVARSTTNTPLVQPKAAISTPTARPSKRTDAALMPARKRKAPTDNDKPAVKRVKVNDEATSTVQKEVGKPKPKTEAPKIRMDRKASVRRASYDDDGELVLENETPVTEKLPTGRSAMSLALSGQLGPGPISLRSAASSPASQVASPMAVRPGNVDEDEGDFEIGGSSPEDTSKPERHLPSADDDGDADQEDEDADVEDLELPSPAAVHKPSVSAATVTSGADEEDDLDKQLALAMAEEDDGGGGGAVPVIEDEEESEEE